MHSLSRVFGREAGSYNGSSGLTRAARTCASLAISEVPERRSAQTAPRVLAPAMVAVVDVRVARGSQVDHWQPADGSIPAIRACFAPRHLQAPERRNEPLRPTKGWDPGTLWEGQRDGGKKATKGQIREGALLRTESWPIL